MAFAPPPSQFRATLLCKSCNRDNSALAFSWKGTERGCVAVPKRTLELSLAVAMELTTRTLVRIVALSWDRCWSILARHPERHPSAPILQEDIVLCSTHSRTICQIIKRGPFDCPEADPALDFPSTSASFLVMALMCPSALFHSGGLGEWTPSVAMCAPLCVYDVDRHL